MRNRFCSKPQPKPMRKRKQKPQFDSQEALDKRLNNLLREVVFQSSLSGLQIHGVFFSLQ
jgi:hypothetical protein